MFQHFLKWMEKRGSYRMIERDGKPYLGRYFLLRIGGRSVYLHRFWASDPDDVHNHPWRWISIMLKGSYREYLVDGSYTDRKAGDFVVRDAGVFHRLEISEGKAGETWTLFFTGKRANTWGFLANGKFQPASDYERQPVDVYGRDFIFKGWIFPKLVWLNK